MFPPALHLRRCGADALEPAQETCVLPWRDASCEEINEHLARLATAEAGRLHVELAALLEVSSEQVFGGDATARASTLRWLASPRSLGQLAVLAHLLNRGMVVCTNVTGTEWEAEILQCREPLPGLDNSQPPAQDDEDLHHFEEELEALSIVPLPQSLIDEL